MPRSNSAVVIFWRFPHLCPLIFSLGFNLVALSFTSTSQVLKFRPSVCCRGVNPVFPLGCLRGCVRFTVVHRRRHFSSHRSHRPHLLHPLHGPKCGQCACIPRVFCLREPGNVLSLCACWQHELREAMRILDSTKHLDKAIADVAEVQLHFFSLVLLSPVGC